MENINKHLTSPNDLATVSYNSKNNIRKVFYSIYDSPV